MLDVDHFCAVELACDSVSSLVSDSESSVAYFLHDFVFLGKAFHLLWDVMYFRIRTYFLDKIMS